MMIAANTGTAKIDVHAAAIDVEQIAVTVKTAVHAAAAAALAATITATTPNRPPPFRPSPSSFVSRHVKDDKLSQ